MNEFLLTEPCWNFMQNFSCKMVSTGGDLSRGRERIPVEIESGIDVHQSGLSDFMVRYACGTLLFWINVKRKLTVYTLSWGLLCKGTNQTTNINFLFLQLVRCMAALQYCDQALLFGDTCYSKSVYPIALLNFELNFIAKLRHLSSIACYAC